MTLLLASSSTTRRAMLEQAGVPVRVVSPDADEEGEKVRLLAGGCEGQELATALAELKALSVQADDELILGADQVLIQADESILSKPASPAHAAEQLRGLAGTTHRLCSAAALASGGQVVWRGAETVSLTMRAFSDAFLADYLEREWDAVRWSIGAYRIEGLGAQLFERIEGSHFAILGLPLIPLLAELRRRGVLAS